LLGLGFLFVRLLSCV